MASLKQSLPTAFRITGSKCEADELMNIVQSQYFSEILNVKLKVEGTEDEEEIKPFKLPWYVLVTLSEACGVFLNVITANSELVETLCKTS